MFDVEEITALTDYVLAAVSLGFAVAIARSIGPHNRVSAWFWCAAFILAVVAGAAGGSYHSLAAATRRPLWTLIVASMSASGAFMIAGIHAADVRRKDGTIAWLTAAIAVTLLGAGVQRLQLTQSAPLDQNGAYHVIQIAGLYLFYRCARTVHDRPGVPLEVHSDAPIEVMRSASRPR